jgi:hypothetical protein
MVCIVLGWLLLGGGEVTILLMESFGWRIFLEKGGDLMTPIVKWTRYGDTIFVSNPYYAAEALVTWACLTHGHSIHSIMNLGNGCVKVDIPGLTSITYAPENMPN